MRRSYGGRISLHIFGALRPAEAFCVTLTSKKSGTRADENAPPCADAQRGRQILIFHTTDEGEVETILEQIRRFHGGGVDLSETQV